jgi:hypothetical protein
VIGFTDASKVRGGQEQFNELRRSRILHSSGSELLQWRFQTDFVAKPSPSGRGIRLTRKEIASDGRAPLERAAFSPSPNHLKKKLVVAIDHEHMNHSKADVLGKDILSPDETDWVIQVVHTVDEVCRSRSWHMKSKLQLCSLCHLSRSSNTL